MKKMFSKQRFLSQVIIYTLIKYDFLTFCATWGWLEVGSFHNFGVTYAVPMTFFPSEQIYLQAF